MKITLEFDLLEEEYAFECALNGNKYRAALEDFSNYLRSEYKHKVLSEEKSKYIEEIRANFYECLDGLEI